MIHRASKRFLVALAVVALLGEAPQRRPSSAAARRHETAPAKTSIEDKLAETTSFEFLDLELSEAVNHIGQKHGMSIMLDRRELEDAGLGTDLPVTVMFDGVKLGAALDLMLRDAELTYIIRDAYLLIHDA